MLGNTIWHLGSSNTLIDITWRVHIVSLNEARKLYTYLLRYYIRLTVPFDLRICAYFGTEGGLSAALEGEFLHLEVEKLFLTLSAWNLLYLTLKFLHAISLLFEWVKLLIFWFIQARILWWVLLLRYVLRCMTNLYLRVFQGEDSLIGDLFEWSREASI